MKITDRVIDDWCKLLNEAEYVADIDSPKLIEILQGLKVERLTLLQQLKNAESQIAHLTYPKME